MSSDEVFDAKEKKVIAALKDEQGKTVSSSKYVEIVFRGSDVIATGDQFGVGCTRPATLMHSGTAVYD